MPLFRRDIIDRLKQWRDSENRKPILLKGARQTGKTWMMEEFDKECFEYNLHFDRVEDAKRLSANSQETLGKVSRDFRKDVKRLFEKEYIRDVQFVILEQK